MPQRVKVFYNEGGKEEFDLDDKFEIIPGPAVMLQQESSRQCTVIPFSSIKKMECVTEPNKLSVVGGSIILPGQPGPPS